MKLFIILFTILLFSQQMSAAIKDDGKAEVESAKLKTFYISGKVNDVVTGESLVGVQLQIEGTDLKTYTDFDGNFAFASVIPGEYKVVANYISYKQESNTLEVSTKNNELEIKLKPLN